MNRTFAAVLLAVGGLTSAAPAQYYYGGTGNTSYYAPASYSNYSYTSGYGPWNALDWRWWTGTPSYSTAYYGYAPSYTASYAPALTTSYYSPSLDSSYVVASSNCCSSCCSSCSSCASCPSGGCASGNCAMNYSPTPANAPIKPEPDPNASGASGAAGSRTFESESNGSGSGGSGSGGDGTGGDGFERYDRSRPSDGFGATPEERGAGYRPPSKIEQKAPADMTDAEPGGAAAPAEAPSGAGAGALQAPAGDAEPDARMPALNLDTKVTSTRSPLRERSRMKARFGSPQLARAKVDPAAIPGAKELQVVQK